MADGALLGSGCRTTCSSCFVTACQLLRPTLRWPCSALTLAPRCPRPAVAQLACARIGAVFSVVFAGFSAESLAGRIVDSNPKAVITCSAVKRGPKVIELKKIVDEVRRRCTAELAWAAAAALCF